MMSRLEGAIALVGFVLIAAVVGAQPLAAARRGSPESTEPIAFTDATEELNIEYVRARSHSYESVLDVYRSSIETPLTLDEVFQRSPHRTGGFPGVALLDHDGDDDTDIYVTNGPGGANALFSNQLAETGTLGFLDVTSGSGAAAVDHDSNGVCYGDFDNDGDEDLFVLGREMGNRLFENIDGTFALVEQSGAEGGTASHIGCSVGDIDGDGLLDIAVANAFQLDTALALVAIPYDLSQRNQLYRNVGDLTFADISEQSGIQEMTLGGTEDPRPPTISWAVAMVDIDRDGDIDVMFGDDQAALPNRSLGGFDRGYLQLFLNDGTGSFTNAPLALNDFSASAWMGLGYGDFDCDGTLDVFGSNLGDYMFPTLGVPTSFGLHATRWMLGTGDGSFVDPGPGSATVFGWGNAVADLDNDGDHDLLYHGAMDLNATITHDNPGVVIENHDCGRRYVENLTAFRGDYLTRGTQGVAKADLDRDGYVDIVTVANHLVGPDMPFIISPASYGSDLDETARMYLPMSADPDTGLLSWTGIETIPGDLTVELNDGEGLGAASFKAVGSVGITEKGRANRSGVGAVVTFTPWRGRSVILPIVGGSSFTSQHALDAHFGMGRARTGVVEIEWPSGVRNRLYRVRPGERLVLPEIPCSFDNDSGLPSYLRCLKGSLGDLVDEDIVSRRHANRLLASMIRAFIVDRHARR